MVLVPNPRQLVAAALMVILAGPALSGGLLVNVIPAPDFKAPVMITVIREATDATGGSTVVSLPAVSGLARFDPLPARYAVTASADGAISELAVVKAGGSAKTVTVKLALRPIINRLEAGAQTIF